MVDPKCEKFKTDKLLPKATRLKMLMLLPSLMNERTLMELLNAIMSYIDTNDPMRLMPNKLQVLPTRAAARIDNELPKVRQSNIESVLPNRACPHNEAELPYRLKLRRDKLDP
jgi:hypothetical protein